MRALLALALLLPLVAAATPESFVQPYLAQGEFAYSRGVEYNGQPYHIVWINATETFVLREAPSQAFSFVNETPLIYGVLLRDFLNQLDISAEISALNSKLQSFNSSRQPRQENCEITTGTKDWPCYDFDTCLQACFSVPSCRAYNQGSGGALVAEILLWRMNNTMLDGNLSLYSQQVSKIAEKTAQVHVEVSTAETYLGKLGQPIAEIRASSLFNECPTCFFYCHPIQFNKSALDSSFGDIASVRAKLAPMANLSQRSDKIRQLTFTRTHGSQYSIMVANMTQAYSGISSRMNGVLPLKDAALDYNLTRLNSTLGMVLANGTSKNYEAAFALEAPFYGIASPMEARLRELEALKAEYDAMRAQVSDIFLNATANANTALSQISNPELRASIERMRNISQRMDELANASNMRAALELKGEFDYEAVNANSLIINITMTYSSLVQSKEACAQRLSEISGKIRANHTGFRQEYDEISARFASASALMSAPMDPSNIAPARSELSVVAQQAAELAERVEKQNSREDWAEMKSGISSAFRLIFFHSR